MVQEELLLVAPALAPVGQAEQVVVDSPVTLVILVRLQRDCLKLFPVAPVVMQETQVI